MKLIISIFARGLMVAGMSSLPFALYFGETQKSMALELQYLVIGSLLFLIGYFIDSKMVKA